jgi:hypothetical protein
MLVGTGAVATLEPVPSLELLPPEPEVVALAARGAEAGVASAPEVALRGALFGAAVAADACPKVPIAPCEPARVAAFAFSPRELPADAAPACIGLVMPAVPGTVTVQLGSLVGGGIRGVPVELQQSAFMPPTPVGHIAETEETEGRFELLHP